LRKYPHTVIFAQKAKWQVSGAPPIPDKTLSRKLDTEVKFPLFTARIAPDTALLGFDLDIDTATGLSGGSKDLPGWFFVLKERPGEVKFGADIPETPPSTSPADWEDLNWGHLGLTQNHIDLDHPDNLTSPGSTTVPWGQNAANMASILYQNPVMIAIHAAEMLDSSLTGKTA